MNTGERSGYSPSSHSFRNRLGRVLWTIVWITLYRSSPRPAHLWRRFLLRLFGARLGRGVHPYPAARIWAPWNLQMGDHSSLADYVDCYCVDRIVLGAYAVVSQYSYLCTASHDYNDARFPLVTAPITIGSHAWICADVYVAPGATIGEGAVVGARASVFHEVPPWTVAVGSPARPIKSREMCQSPTLQKASER